MSRLLILKRILKMEIIKISMLLRSSEIIWSYKKASNSEFWEDIGTKFCEIFVDKHIVHKKNGNFQHIFYILTDKDSSEVKSAVKNIISEMRQYLCSTLPIYFIPQTPQ
jgi:hypothetical protein